MDSLQLDRSEQSINIIKEEILKAQPFINEFASISINKLPKGNCHLNFIRNDRSCTLKESNQFHFNALGKAIFNYEGNIEKNAILIKNWLSGALPSELINEFELLELSHYSEFLENSELLKELFKESWERVISYLNLVHEDDNRKVKIIKFFESLISKSYNEKTRASLSMRSIIFSRSKYSNSKLPNISISFYDRDENLGNSLLIESNWNNNSVKNLIEVNEEIERFFDELIENEIH